jgi:hypothetical protein
MWDDFVLCEASSFWVDSRLLTSAYFTAYYCLLLPASRLLPPASCLLSL